MIAVASKWFPFPQLPLPSFFILNPEWAFHNMNLIKSPLLTLKTSVLLREPRLLNPRPKIFSHLAPTYFSQRPYSHQSELLPATHMYVLSLGSSPSHRFSLLPENIISFHPHSSAWLTPSPPAGLKPPWHTHPSKRTGGYHIPSITITLALSTTSPGSSFLRDVEPI